MRGSTRRQFFKVGGAATAGLAFGTGARAQRTSARVASACADAWIEIDVDTLAWNLAQVRDQVEDRPVMAVLKADAYGHGLVETARALEARGVAAIAVGKIREAIDLHEAGVQVPILNLGPFLPADAEEIVRREIRQAVFTDEVALLADAAHRLEKRAWVHLQVDTGLGRVGVPTHQAARFVERVAGLAGVEIEGFFTALTEDAEFDAIQLRRLLELCEKARLGGIEPGLRHAASSAAVCAFPDAWLDMVRPGIALYGEYPSTAEAQERRIDLRPAMTLKARVSYVKNLRPGDAVSYHRAFVAERETRVATLAIGYSDGYPPQVVGKAEVLLGGRRRKTLALVTCNHVIVDVTGDETIGLGQEAVLLGRQGDDVITAEELAAWADTSVYKILIGMNPLLPRIHRES